jgi:hypothetical protein
VKTQALTGRLAPFRFMESPSLNGIGGKQRLAGCDEIFSLRVRGPWNQRVRAFTVVNATFRQSGKKAGRQEFRLEKSGEA